MTIDTNASSPVIPDAVCEVSRRMATDTLGLILLGAPSPRCQRVLTDKSQAHGYARPQPVILLSQNAEPAFPRTAGTEP